jgi:hypothetical protein
LIYLFNGLEPANFSTILQPVLQWGDSGMDEDGVQRTGQFWTVASWIVPAPDGDAHHTPHVRVKPGETLVGVMTLVSQSGGNFVYTCEFEGISGTNFTTPSIPELMWCVETLEAYEDGSTATAPYDLNSAQEWPATRFTAFQDISIQTGGVAATGNWQPPTNTVTEFGEHSVLITDSTTSGEVDIYYTN